MKRSDLVPFKQVTAQLGFSRATIWRARMSGIEGFPQPVMVSRYVFWKRTDLDKLEDALLRYQGRVKFERRRDAEAKIEAARRRLKPSRRDKRRPSAKRQPDLFERC